MLDWLPIYPARIATVMLLGAAFQPHYAGSSFPTPSISSWQAHYPDRIERKVQHPSQQPALFQAGRIAIPDAAVPPLAWEPQFPDQIARRRLPVAGIPSLFGVPFARATELTQFPSFPDRIDRPKVHPSGQQSLAFKLEAVPPLLGWQGEQPSFVRRATTVPHIPAFVFYSLPVPAPDPPGLGFESTSYPTAVRPLAISRLPVARQQSFAANLSPLPNAAPPTGYGSWQSVYPDFLPRATRLTAGLTLVETPGAIPVDLRWSPTYPDQFPRPVWIAQDRVVPILLGSLPAIAAELSWLPSYPDRIVRALNSNDFFGFDPLSVASLLPIPPDCMEWTRQTLDQPSFTDESITRSHLSDEDVTGPSLTQEQIC